MPSDLCPTQIGVPGPTQIVNFVLVFKVTTTNDKNEVSSESITDFDKENFEKMEINAIAIKLLHYGLGSHEHNRVMGAKPQNKLGIFLKSLMRVRVKLRD